MSSFFCFKKKTAYELRISDWISDVCSSDLSAIAQPQLCCHITQTTPASHALIRENLHRAPLYSGQIESVGPRYCPSIEDKVVRFADRSQHQIFLEPEGRSEEHTSELQSLMRISYAVFCLKKKTNTHKALTTSK